MPPPAASPAPPRPRSLPFVGKGTSPDLSLHLPCPYTPGLGPPQRGYEAAEAAQRNIRAFLVRKNSHFAFANRTYCDQSGHARNPCAMHLNYRESGGHILWFDLRMEGARGSLQR